MQTVYERPKVCNLCGGKVIYTTNDRVYKRQFGSGYCYICTECEAYVGTHINEPKKALGILANAEMREWRGRCHKVFDSLWRGKSESSKRRTGLYKFLANRIGQPVFHFGWADLETLKSIYPELLKLQQAAGEGEQNEK